MHRIMWFNIFLNKRVRNEKLLISDQLGQSWTELRHHTALTMELEPCDYVERIVATPTVGNVTNNTKHQVHWPHHLRTIAFLQGLTISLISIEI